MTSDINVQSYRYRFANINRARRSQKRGPFRHNGLRSVRCGQVDQIWRTAVQTKHWKHMISAK